ncbi:MAG TPA: sigma-70 family RNA polymerase sigma factor [Conexibacter sp.]|nr:sigma-70 family RNA polymerase sigma factor [Conexibacter sp.]
MAPTDRNDAGLLAAIARGDDAAFEVIYRRYLPLVVRWSLMQTRNAELAADLSAEVFAVVVSAARRYRPDRGTVAAWLLGIARNKLLESHRRGRVQDSARRRLGVEPIGITDADLERVEELASLDQRLSELVEALPEDLRDALVRRVVDEQPYDQIAAELQCSELAVRQRVSRGLKMLRSEVSRG